MKKVNVTTIGLLLVFAVPAVKMNAQQPARVEPARVQPVTDAVPATPASASAATEAVPAKPPSTYLLGPDDQIMIQGPEMEEVVNKPYRIAPDNYVSLPILGRVKAG